MTLSIEEAAAIIRHSPADRSWMTPLDYHLKKGDEWVTGTLFLYTWLWETPDGDNLTVQITTHHRPVPHESQLDVFYPANTYSVFSGKVRLNARRMIGMNSFRYPEAGLDHASDLCTLLTA